MNHSFFLRDGSSDQAIFERIILRKLATPFLLIALLWGMGYWIKADYKALTVNPVDYAQIVWDYARKAEKIPPDQNAYIALAEACKGVPEEYYFRDSIFQNATLAEKALLDQGKESNGKWEEIDRFLSENQEVVKAIHAALQRPAYGMIATGKDSFGNLRFDGRANYYSEGILHLEMLQALREHHTEKIIESTRAWLRLYRFFATRTYHSRAYMAENFSLVTVTELLLNQPDIPSDLLQDLEATLTANVFPLDIHEEISQRWNEDLENLWYAKVLRKWADNSSGISYEQEPFLEKSPYYFSLLAGLQANSAVFGNHQVRNAMKKMPKGLNPWNFRQYTAAGITEKSIVPFREELKNGISPSCSYSFSQTLLWLQKGAFYDNIRHIVEIRLRLRLALYERMHQEYPESMDAWTANDAESARLLAGFPSQILYQRTPGDTKPYRLVMEAKKG